MRSAPENNVNATTTIEYEVIENAFDASALSSGAYLYVLLTPTQRFHKLMEVAK